MHLGAARGTLASADRLSIGARAGHALAAGTLCLLALASPAQAPAPAPPTGDCHLDCGEVLKQCLERARNRYLCIDLTDACMQQCRAGEAVLDPSGRALLTP